MDCAKAEKYEELGTKQGERKVYKIPKSRNNKSKDVKDNEVIKESNKLRYQNRDVLEVREKSFEEYERRKSGRG